MRHCLQLNEITIRSVRANDRERIVRAFLALEPESVYQRFFALKKNLSDGELRRLTECDGFRDVVLVATVGVGSQETIVALGQYARSGATAEIAFIVEEDYQGCGLAGALLQQLTHIALDGGVTRFEAYVLADNAAMLKVFRRSGLPLTESESEGIAHVTLVLEPEAAGPQAAGSGYFIRKRHDCDRTSTFPLPQRHTLQLLSL
jgi:RimJ/RimL family protein N-acetyltransferase